MPEARSAREQDNSEPRRPKNRAGKARRYFRRSKEKLKLERFELPRAEALKLMERDTEARNAREH